jgi:hypothetical protein
MLEKVVLWIGGCVEVCGDWRAACALTAMHHGYRVTLTRYANHSTAASFVCGGAISLQTAEPRWSRRPRETHHRVKSLVTSAVGLRTIEISAHACRTPKNIALTCAPVAILVMRLLPGPNARLSTCASFERYSCRTPPVGTVSTPSSQYSAVPPGCLFAAVACEQHAVNRRRMGHISGL